MDADELSLWTTYQADRSIANRNALIDRYLPVLRAIAAAIHQTLPRGHGLDVDDLISDGLPGLIQSIGRFDLQRGLQFATFATLRIRGEIQDALRRRDWVPRLERVRLAACQEQALRIGSLDGLVAATEMPVEGFSGGLRVTDQVDAEQDEFWRQVCRGLDRRDRLILMLYWRLGLTMRDVGRHVGVSESRVSQAMSELLDRLKQRADLHPAAEPPRLPRARGRVWCFPPAVHAVAGDDGLYDYVPPDYATRGDQSSGRMVMLKLEEIEAEIGATQLRLELLTGLQAMLKGERKEPLSLEEMERNLIEATFAVCDGDRQATAKSLGINERTLRVKLRAYGYQPHGKPGSNRVEAGTDVQDAAA